MIAITIPGYKDLNLSHLVLDFNGTLATDGRIISGVNERLAALSENLGIHVLTADTFGTVRAGFQNTPYTVSVLGKDNQDKAKLDYVKKLGAQNTVAVGNGRNDRRMLEGSALGIAITGDECAAFTTIKSADIVAPNILCALDLLLNPLRMTATLRS